MLFGVASTQALTALIAAALARGAPALQGLAPRLPLVGPVPAPVLAALPAAAAVVCTWGGLQVASLMKQNATFGSSCLHMRESQFVGTCIGMCICHAYDGVNLFFCWTGRVLVGHAETTMNSVVIQREPDMFLGM